MLTTSSVVGAPVEWCRKRLRTGRTRGLVVSSGVSNVGMGERGHRDNRVVAEQAAGVLGCRPEEIMTAATGVIGQPLPVAKIRRGLPRAADALEPGGLGDAAEAIRTTDTFAKTASRRIRVDGKTVTIAGMAKGSGMIEPRMATMLAFVFTDAAVALPQLRRVVSQVADASFNRLTIDGETSTSDTFLCFANARAGNRSLRNASSPGAARFQDGLLGVCQDLVRDLARDGEGATKLVTIDVRGARSAAEAERAARRVANSMLIKTAIFGRDPNWGRILQTIGAAQVAIRPERARIRLCGVPVWAGGASTGPAARRRAAGRMDASEVEIEVDLGTGRHATRMWTCDLSYDYVRINAEYTT